MCDLRFAIYDLRLHLGIEPFAYLQWSLAPVATYPPNEVSRASGRKRGAPRRRAEL